LGQKVTALDRVGIYVPGGKAAYPSSVLMNAIPAKVAGVSEVIMVVPTPDGARNSLVLAAAYLSGVDRVFTIGGAQAVAALAYGTATVPAVDQPPWEAGIGATGSPIGRISLQAVVHRVRFVHYFSNYGILAPEIRPIAEIDRKRAGDSDYSPRIILAQIRGGNQSDVHRDDATWNLIQRTVRAHLVATKCGLPYHRRKLSCNITTRFLFELFPGMQTIVLTAPDGKREQRTLGMEEWQSKAASALGVAPNAFKMVLPKSA
jgi:hypothetical protein